MKNIYFFFFILSLLINIASGATTDYSIIIKKNIFSNSPPPLPAIEQNTNKTSILKPVQIPLPNLNNFLELKGIVFMGEEDSYALINLKRKNEEFIFKVGDIIEEAELVRIEEKRVVFSYDANRVVMELEKDEGGGFIEVVPGIKAKVDTPNISITPVSTQTTSTTPEFTKPIMVNLEATMKEVMQDKDTLKNLNISPKIQDGKIEGFSIGNIPTDSIIYQYGFRNGDILKRVNGIPIDSMARGFSVYNQITRDRVDIVNVEVLRNNSSVFFTFKLQ